MKTFNWKILLFFCLTLIYSLDANIVKVLHETIKDLKPHRILIFYDNSVKVTKNCDYIFKIFNSDIPTLSLDISNLHFTGMSRSLQVPTVHPDQSVLYLVLMREKMVLERTWNILNKIMLLSPSSARPKCLFITSSSTDYSEDLTRKVLRNAWSLKFLDFTVLKIDAENQTCTFVNWNPFTNQYGQGHVRNHYNKLFPDKLANVNQYPLKISVFQHLPRMAIEKKNNNSTKIDGNIYGFIEIIHQRLNFKLDITFEPMDILQNTYKNVLVKLENNIINVLPTVLSLTRFENKSVVVAYPISSRKLLTVVPDVLTLDYHVPFELLITAVTFPLVLSVFTVLKKLLNFKSKHWSILQIFQILIGLPTTQPRRAKERIVFSTIVILSTLYTNMFFSVMTNTKIKREELQLKTYDDILKSDLPIYTYYQNMSKQYLPPRLEKIFSISKMVKNDQECVDKVLEKNYAVCITNEAPVRFYVKKYLNPDGSPILKIAPPSFSYHPTVMAFEKASPFAEKFSKMILHIFEAKLARGLNVRPEVRFEQTTSEIEIDILLDMLKIVLVAGYSVATFAFFFESRIRIVAVAWRIIICLKSLLQKFANFFGSKVSSLFKHQRMKMKITK